VETYRRIRNTFRFLHANLHGDFDPAEHRVPYEKLSYLDQWILSRLQNLVEKVREAYRTYAFHTIYHTIHNFCAIDLSALYLDIIKDRMYVEKKDALKRRASQSVVFETLTTLLRLAAPILSFTTDEMWSYLKPFVKEESVLLSTLPEVDRAHLNDGIEKEWDRIWEIREAVNKKIEEKRVEKIIGHPLDAKVRLELPPEDYKLMNRLGDELKDLLIVSQVDLARGDVIGVVVSSADGEKCQRCWQYSTDLQTIGEFPKLCKRCRDTLIS
jgi:isoleucyl-tRNA synthetase